MSLPGVYCAKWPVLDLDRTMTELVVEATPLLLEMLERAGVDVLTAPVWDIRESATGAVFLLANCDVVSRGHHARELAA
ncbi:hypothetical protein [Pseudactinotalea suaedae]|uniref:hypothetical protein n=1 Tax=Pseudactinotalea suaedae TaxID=1524924 RepID=UPI0012E1953F|nr:hypothetical protein [Pseudactinotalea suaedae]